MSADRFAALRPVGWHDRVAALFAPYDQPGTAPARVARMDRGHALLVTPDGPRRHPHDRGGTHLVTGDWVAVTTDGVAMLDRWSAIRRARGAGQVEQPLAANVDVVAVAVGLDRPFNRRRLERLVTLVWDSGALPVVALTKADVADDADAIAAEAALLAPGCDVVVTSAARGRGIEAVAALAGPGRTLAVIGESGAGKSTLVNRLVGGAVQSTRAVRSGNHKGRHTTSARELVPLPPGPDGTPRGVLLDTPGLRSVGLPPGSADAVDRTFSDVAALVDGCRFADCAHDTEPGCAVRAAEMAGVLPAGRLAAYRKLVRELAWAERRADVRARRAEERRWGRLMKAVAEADKRAGPVR
jgi:ribosome biogenesis GTPase / thiamine phosphate phosphatase